MLESLYTEEQRGWADRDRGIPATEWTPEQRGMYEQMGTALRTAADRYIPLMRRTEHRIIRELLETSRASILAYTDALPHYTAADNALIHPSINAGAVLTEICAAVSAESATERAALATAPATPVHPPTPADPDRAGPLMAEPDPICANLKAVFDQYHPQLADFQATNSAIPAVDWTPEQRAINDAAAPLLQDQARQYLQLAGHTDAPAVADLLTLAGLYQQVYVATIETHVPGDAHLYNTAVYAARTVGVACADAEHG